jgi:hypothetical protein
VHCQPGTLQGAAQKRHSVSWGHCRALRIRGILSTGGTTGRCDSPVSQRHCRVLLREAFLSASDTAGCYLERNIGILSAGALQGAAYKRILSAGDTSGRCAEGVYCEPGILQGTATLLSAKGTPGCCAERHSTVLAGGTAGCCL